MRILTAPGVFKPRSDSWLLATHVANQRLPRDRTVLDVCTGSGILAVTAAQTGAEVTAIDVSRRAVLAATINARLNGVHVRALRGDLFGPVRSRRFDLIVSNPPYLPGDDAAVGSHNQTRAWEGGRTGRRVLDAICLQAAAHLRPRGVLLLVHSSVCGEQATLAALEATGLEAQTVDRRPGPLGPLLRSRAQALAERSLLTPDGGEELLVIRATAPT